MQISEAAGGVPAPGAEPCRFPKLEECAHFHYERVQLPQVQVTLQTSMDHSLHSQHTTEEDDIEWYMVQVTSRDECWLLQRNYDNFKMLDAQLHQCIYDRKISQLPDLASHLPDTEDIEAQLIGYLERFSDIIDNSLNCGPVLNWLQMDNKGHRLLVPSEESRSINTPAVAAAYSVRRYVSQARDELNLEVGDMISVIDMANPGESMWWRGKRGFQVGFFPQHCVHIIGDKVPRNIPLPPPVVGSLALTPIKPVLRKHGKLITFFRSFILNRPSRRRLKQSGILKERVFGCDLGEHLLNSGHTIPMVLKCCAEFIEKHGIVDGIYRLSGVNSNIQKLRNAFDEDRIPNLYTEDILQDIHSVACLLKMYFRELPNPLCTYQLYQSFVNAVQGSSTAKHNSEHDNERLLKMREAVQKLPPPHYRTLEYLMRHLAKVAKHGVNTGMTTRNVAIVWAPNLLRCEELEYGGVAALQGVGVQAVVTEFLICYADLIFCDHLPNLDLPNLEIQQPGLSPRKCRPKSLAISTPTKLITLEEARSKILLNKTEEYNYIEVGGGPKNLPKTYHTIIDLPPGSRKRNSKRSPLGWRSFFTKARNTSQGNLSKTPRKASTPGITIAEKSVTESDLTDMKRKLRTVKSAESLTSGHSEPASNEIDVLGPLHCLNKPPGHNRSVSHDSYFDTLQQNSQNNSEGSLLDLSEIQLNFDLEDLEMRIFSEDESLVSSPRIQKDMGYRRILTRARPEEFSSTTNSGNPSPKKQARVVMSPDSMSRKRTRLEEQLSDIQYIDCCTPDNIVSTTAVIHSFPHTNHDNEYKQSNELYQPKNKSPRNSENLDKRHSLNLNSSSSKTVKSKPFTEMEFETKLLGASNTCTTPTPQSPVYRQLGESSSNTTPGISPDFSSPTEINYKHLNKPKEENRKSFYENTVSTEAKTPTSPNYENILTTINITYKSPKSSTQSSPVKTNFTSIDTPYENITIVNPEKALIPTSVASLPIQQASQPDLSLLNDNENLVIEKEQRPRSLSALEDINLQKKDTKTNLSSTAVCDTNEQLSLISLTDQKTFSSNQSSSTNIQYTQSICSAPYHFIENAEQLSPTDLSLSEVVQSSTENLTTSNTSLSFPLTPSKHSPSPIVSPTQIYDNSGLEVFTPVSLTDTKNFSETSLLEETDNVGTSVGITQFSTDSEKIDEIIENVPLMKPISLNTEEVGSLPRPPSFNLIDFSPAEPPQDINIKQESPSKTLNSDKRKSSETESLDDNAIYQQVKYFRRSIHEVNALLDLQNEEENKIKIDNVYEDVRGADTDNVEDKTNLEEKSSLDENFDSLEAGYDHVYENIEGSDMRENNIYENVEINDKTESIVNSSVSSKNVEDIPDDKISVKDLKNKFEEKEFSSSRSKSLNSLNRNSYDNISLKNANDVVLERVKNCNENKINNSTNSEGVNKLKKFYEKDSLPPCLRARNLKNQLKTRSLDEEEFKKEFGYCKQRRKSLDESLAYKTNSLPKMLNQPKLLPMDYNEKLDSLHLSHSTENLNASIDEEQKKRERIEKYKEERRKFLQDKYRSESFKEDKEVLLSKLKIYKPKDEKTQSVASVNETEKPGRTRRKSSRSDDSASSDLALDSLEEDVTKSKSSSNCLSLDKSTCEKSVKSTEVVKPTNRESLKSRAAMFENPRRNSKNSEIHGKQTEPSNTKKNTVVETNEKKSNIYTSSNKFENKVEDVDELKEDFIRHKIRDDELHERNERRRHTCETRERESETDRIRRVSLESRSSPRKEKTSPPYCIKDMKAIFESKSKQ